VPKFGAKSLSILSTVDIRIQRVMHRVVSVRDITIISGARFEDEQNRYFDKGVSKKRWPDSRHNRTASGRVLIDKADVAGAIDIAPWNTEQRKQIPWEDTKAFIHLAGIVDMAAFLEGIELRWGGNWDRDEIIMDDQTFQDLGHYEIV